jgi:hypothetical protein
MGSNVDPIVNILNSLLSKNLPAINQALRGAIVGNNLDPLRSVASGSDTLGHIDLGICTASASANYYVANLTGLSSFSIQSLAITGASPVHDQPNAVSGTLALNASVGGMGAHVGGSFKAGCGFISQSVGISGSVSINSASVASGGDFIATTSGGEVSITYLDVEGLSLTYQGLSVSIDGLGIFNKFLSPLEDLIIGQFQGSIRSAIAGAITPVINTQLAKLVPLTAPL